MKVSKYLDTKPTPELPGVMKRDVIGAADGAPRFNMRVFDVESGKSTPEHTHWWEHEVYVLSGQGVVKSEKGETPISRDSVIFVAPNELHSFINKGKDPLRFICVIPLLT